MRLIILDRDGVLNYDSDDYIKTPAEWVPIPGSLEAVARLNQAGYRVVIVTNQSALARKLMDIEALTRIHEKMHQQLAAVGGAIDAVFFCPHGPDDGCACRKPRPGLFHELAERLHIELADVPAIGDSLRDAQAAKAAGARPLLVRTGKGERSLRQAVAELAGVPVYDDLAAATDALLQRPPAENGF